ncbi:MAG: transglutaminase domain-containing protein [Alphaproteobacteria bacterium]|nr:transglutaminase domain-containing protein [Alphaproteobacteria bacterium]
MIVRTAGPAAVALALAVLSACRPAPPDGHGQLWLRDVPIADMDRRGTSPVTWTTTHHLVEGDLVATRTATLAADGTLRTWTLSRPGLTVQLELDGAAATWSRTHEGGDDHGTLALPGPVRWALAPGWDDVAVGTSTWLWADDHAVSVAVDRDGDTVILRGDDGATWALRTGADGAVTAATFPDGSTLAAGDGPIAPIDPVALLRLDSDPIPRPRTVRRLVARWSTGGAPFTLTRPDRAELGHPPLAAQAALSPNGVPLALPDLVVPVDVPLAAADRLALLEAAHVATRQRHGGSAWTPDRADCRALAATLAGILRHHGLAARVVQGWVAVGDAPTVFERHAWVALPWSDAIPWLHTDPALGQLVADATHVPDTLAPQPLRPETRLVALEVVGADGPQPRRP